MKMIRKRVGSLLLAAAMMFTYISSHPAKESIDYVVGRGLLSGIYKTTFAFPYSVCLPQIIPMIPWTSLATLSYHTSANAIPTYKSSSFAL